MGLGRQIGLIFHAYSGILDDNLKFIKIKFINIFLINHMVADIKMFN